MPSMHQVHSSTSFTGLIHNVKNATSRERSALAVIVKKPQVQHYW